MDRLGINQSLPDKTAGQRSFNVHVDDREPPAVISKPESHEKSPLQDPGILRAYREALKNGSVNDDRILVSACLAGMNCRYDGGNNLSDSIRKLVLDGKAVTVCPEQLGGLPTPRIPAEIVGGDGREVLQGSSRVLNKLGDDVSDQFIRGAQLTLEIAASSCVILAVLKSKSPSCGVGKIYDGTFSGVTKKGDGTAAAKLRDAGIAVFSEDEWNMLE